jgi:hypothetical protein
MMGQKSTNKTESSESGPIYSDEPGLLCVDSGCAPLTLLSLDVKRAFTPKLTLIPLELQTAGPLVQTTCKVGVLQVQVLGTNGKPVEISLSGCLMTPACSGSLLSLRHMMKEGYHVDFNLTDGILTTLKNEKVRLTIDSEGMWVFPWDTSTLGGTPLMSNKMDLYKFKHKISKSAKLNPSPEDKLEKPKIVTHVSILKNVSSSKSGNKLTINLPYFCRRYYTASNIHYNEALDSSDNLP